ncbi:MAG: sigma-70 family RNA polymerase sigma factor [Ignavibacteriaceae bacterium]
MALTDTDLITKARQGDSSAFEELVFRYDKRVLSMALKYVQNKDDAKDIYQEVFIRVYKGLQNFQFRSEFSTWLFRITTNVCLTHSARGKKRINVPINDEYDEEEMNGGVVLESVSHQSSPEKYLSSSEITEQVNRAVETLSPKQKMIFVMKHYEGYKLKEIAMMMDCQEGTVKKYLFEANHKMRKLLKNIY